jgi:hypothetical protein
MTDIPMAATPSSIHVGQVLSRAFALLSGDFAKFFILALVIWSPYLLFTLGVTDASSPDTMIGSLGILVLSVPLNILSQATILYGALQKMRGQEFSVGTSLAQGLARFFPILGMLICFGIGVGIGSLLLVVPGIMLLVAWYVALPACIIERMGPFQSLTRSAELTKGNRWRIFGIMVVIYAASDLVQIVVQLVLLSIGGTIVSVIGVFAWISFFQAFNSIVIAVVYHDLRVAREGVDIDHIAAAFD